MQIRTRLLATLTAAAMVAGSVTPAAATSQRDRDFLRGVAATALVGGLIYYTQQNRTRTQEQTYYAPVTRQAAPQQVYRQPAPAQQQASYRAPVQFDAIASGFRDLSFEQRRTVQLRLQRQGYYQDRIDGVWGPNTQRALRAYAIDSGYGQSLDTSTGASQVYRSLLY